MVNLVTIADERYLVDVGFGPNGATSPLRLEENTLSTTIHPAVARLVWKNISDGTSLTPKLWCLQVRFDDGANFEDMYCFSELEFLPTDFELMNYYASTSPKSWFTQRVICAKLILSDAAGEEPMGSLILQNDLKRRVHGKTEHMETFQNETERLQALKDAFNISLSTSQRHGIRGMVSEIKPA
jgi:arylamine N-acetyltransferase